MTKTAARRPAPAVAVRPLTAPPPVGGRGRRRLLDQVHAYGFLLGGLFALLTVSLRVDQVLVGLAITIFGGGLTAFLYRDVFGGQNPSLTIGSSRIAIPGLSQIPILGGLFGTHTTASSETQNVIFIVPTVVDVVSMQQRAMIEEALQTYDDYSGNLDYRRGLVPPQTRAQ